MPTYRIETSQGTYDIEADREPTQEEALTAIGSPAPRVSGRVPRTPEQGVFQEDPNTALQVLKRGAIEALPFSNAPSEFREGMRSGQQLVSPAVTGKNISNVLDVLDLIKQVVPGVKGREDFSALFGGSLGSARAANTLFNPAAKVIGEVPKVGQAVGSISAGDLESALKDLSGSRQVDSMALIPSLDTGIAALDVPINTLTGATNEAFIKQPAGLLMLTPGAIRGQAAAIRNFPSNVAAVSGDVAAATRGATGKVLAPLESGIQRLRGRGINPEEVALLERNILDKKQIFESAKGQDAATALKAAEDLKIAEQELSQYLETRNAQTLTLEENLARLNQEAEATRSAALAAESELGTQIQDLNLSAAEAPNVASALRGSLPAPEGPLAIGTSISESIKSERQKARPEITEDYSAVTEAVGENQPLQEAPTFFQRASTLSAEESRGLKSLGDKKLNAVLDEASQVKKVKNPQVDEITPEARYIYENLPDSQKQAFLDQMVKKTGEPIVKEVRPKYTWGDMEQTYKKLNSKIEELRAKGDINGARVLRELKQALSEDMASYAESIGSDAKALFDEANANFQAYSQKFGTSRITPLIDDLATERPSMIVNKIVKGQNAEVINNLREILPPEKFQQVQSQFADQLLSPSRDVPFDPVHFVKEFNKKGYDETLRSVFGEEGFQQLQQINDLSKSAEQAKVTQSVLDDFNNKAQTAQDAYLNAKTAAEQNRLLDGIKSEAQKAVDAAKERIREIETEQKGVKSQERNERMQRDVDDAVKALEKAKTPEQVSLAVRALYGVGSFAALAYTGSPMLGIAAGTLAAAFGRFVHRDIAKPTLDAILKKR